MKIQVEKENKEFLGESLQEKIMEAIDLDKALKQCLDNNI